jgi:hypothetical protein
MTKILMISLLLCMGCGLLSAGCAKRVYYTNVFGEYTLSDADSQYEELFQMKPAEYKKFLCFKDGWCMADVNKMREMGVEVATLCERYCRMTDIKVPFPWLVDYDLLRESNSAATPRCF